MVTREQYDEARKQKLEADAVINAWHLEQLQIFEARWDLYLAGKQHFTDDELCYSRDTLCPCGHGLAYPKGCGIRGSWDCSALLKGTADSLRKHSESLPFAFYDIKSEHPDIKQSTRGVFKPKE